MLHKGVIFGRFFLPNDYHFILFWTIKLYLFAIKLRDNRLR